MLFPGTMLLILAFVYFKFTKDTPKGNYADIERAALAFADDGALFHEIGIDGCYHGYFLLRLARVLESLNFTKNTNNYCLSFLTSSAKIAFDLFSKLLRI